MSLYPLLVVCAVASAALGAAVVQRSSSDDCPQEYLDIDSKHTMCLTDVGIPLTLTQEDKVKALEQHNKIRTSVSATDMLKLAWDEDLALVATKWAAQCTVGHDAIRDLPKMPGVHVGQNMAAGYKDLTGAIEGWRAEVKDFTYGQGTSKVVGHYTQIVNSRTALVGCGMADCPSSPYRKFQICNYAEGQMSSALQRPYQSGSSCERCPDSCDNTGRLCDCGGKVCFNGGTLNVNTCQCQCTKLYHGQRCLKVNCYPDQSFCPGLPATYGKDVCTKYSNVPEMCPSMCGVC